ncbi:MAG: glycosyltransferase [Umezawaea sp.]
MGGPVAHAVVTTAVGAPADIVVDGTTGVLVPPSDPHALGHALHGLLTDSTRREMYRVAGADRVRSRYSWDRIGQETVAVYQDVVNDAANRNGAEHTGAG